MKTTTELTELSMDELSMVAGGGDNWELGDTDGNGNYCFPSSDSPSGMQWYSADQIPMP